MNELFARHSGAAVAETDEEPADMGFDDDMAAHMLNSDPLRHTRLRALVGKAFTAQRIERWRPRVSEVTERLLDQLAGRPQVDLIAEYAVPLPITTICDLFGMPAEDREDFRQWSVKLVGAGQDPDEVADASKNMVNTPTR